MMSFDGPPARAPTVQLPPSLSCVLCLYKDLLYCTTAAPYSGTVYVLYCTCVPVSQAVVTMFKLASGGSERMPSNGDFLTPGCRDDPKVGLGE